MFGRSLKRSLGATLYLVQAVMGGSLGHRMMQGVSEQLSSTGDREVQGKDLRGGSQSLLPNEQSNLG